MTLIIKSALELSNALINDPINTVKNATSELFELSADVFGSAFGDRISQEGLNNRVSPFIGKLDEQFRAGDYYNLGANFPVSVATGLVGANSLVTNKVLFGRPQGVSSAQFRDLSSMIRARADELGLGDDIFVQGSRATHQSMSTSDLDIAIRVSPERFNDFLFEQSRFNKVNLSPSDTRGLEHALRTGKIARGESRLSAVGKQIEKNLGISEVQISVIRAGGSFDHGAKIPIK